MGPSDDIAFSWLIGSDWAVPGPDAVGSRVTVTFSPTDAGTRVTLVHDQLDAHGPGWESIRDGVGSDGGWPAGLRNLPTRSRNYRYRGRLVGHFPAVRGGSRAGRGGGATHARPAPYG
ncbi:MAG TPA: SRPBCC domain-containing protein [Acidimicrobiales bacterium]|nr:SRPBCC domain-containing protein [Acidimicrobiales bacterium]